MGGWCVIVMLQPLVWAWLAMVAAAALLAELEPAAWRWTRGAALLQDAGLWPRAVAYWVLLLPTGWGLVFAGVWAWTSLAGGGPWLWGAGTGAAVWTAVWAATTLRAWRAARDLRRAFEGVW